MRLNLLIVNSILLQIPTSSNLHVTIQTPFLLPAMFQTALHVELSSKGLPPDAILAFAKAVVSRQPSLASAAPLPPQLSS